MEIKDKEGNPLTEVDFNGYRLDKVQEIVTMMEDFLSDVVIKVNSYGDGETGGGGTGGNVSLPFYTKSEILSLLSGYAMVGQLSELISTLVSGRVAELQNSGALYGEDSPEIITLTDRLENIHKLCYGYGFDGVVDLNYVPYNISIENIKNAVNGQVSSISALNNVVFTQSGNQTQVLNLALKDDVGDKATLATTNKASIVSAINELKSQQINANDLFPAGATGGQALTFNGSTRVWSDVDAKKILTKPIDISSFTGKNGQVLKYNESANKFELGVITSGDTLPSGGTAGQVLSTDGLGNESWIDAGISLPAFMAKDDDGIKVFTDDTKAVVASVLGRKAISGGYQNIVPVMTSNTSPSGVAEAFFEDYGYEAYKAFDGNPNSYTSMSGVYMLDYTFTSAKVVKGYSITVRSDDFTGAPKTWMFLAYTGTEWVMLDNQPNEVTFTAGEKKVFTMSNTTAYSKYRLEAYTTHGKNRVQIVAFEILEAVPIEYSYGISGVSQATETTLGGVKAKAKTTETSEVAIDTTTGKLYSMAPGESLNGVPSGGVAGQILKKVDGADYNSVWGDPPASVGVPIVVVNVSKNILGTDVGTLQRCDSTTPITITIPATESNDVGSEISFVRYGASNVNFVAESGRTIVSSNSYKFISGVYGTVTLKKMSSSEWLLLGSLSGDGS